MRSLELLAIACLALLPGCVAYDPPPQDAVPVPANVDRWTHVSIKNWGHLNWDKHGEALGLLGNRDVISISRERDSSLIEAQKDALRIEPVTIPSNHQLYLVKARGYGISGGKVRFNKNTRELSVYLVAYNGEISFPGMRWPVRDLPIVVALPSKPSKVHKSASIGGDSSWHLMDHE